VHSRCLNVNKDGVEVIIRR